MAEESSKRKPLVDSECGDECVSMDDLDRFAERFMEENRAVFEALGKV